MSPLWTFNGHFSFLSAMLAVAGAAGWFAIAPFRARLRYPVLLAPLAGILLVTLAALGFYVIVLLPMGQAAVAGLAATLALSVAALVCWRPRFSWRDAFVPAGLALVVSLLTIRLVTAASIHLGGVAMLYMDGTDHLGYAQTADWVNTHRITEPPIVDPTQPYESAPAVFFEKDSRSGSYIYLALVALALGQPGMFAWDDALALVLAATVLAVAGTFARSSLTLGLLAAGLLTSHWFDYGRCGYLGKVLGYPGAFMTVGLFMASASASRRVALVELVGLVLLVTGTTMMHSGFATGMFVLVIGGVFLAGQWLGADKTARTGMAENAVLLALLAGIAVLATGTLARPFVLAFPDWKLSWAYELPRVADLENQGAQLTGLSPAILERVAWLHLVMWLVAGGLAIRRRASVASALLVGPALLLGLLYLLNARAAIFQMIGTFYPLSLCGLMVLTDSPADVPTGPRRWLAPARVSVGFAVIVISAHQYRFAGAVARYAGDKTPPSACYSQSQMDALAALVGQDKVDVEVNQPQPAIALLVELGRRNANLQWSPESWRTVVGYRKLWSPPQYTQPGKWRIVSVGAPDVPPAQVVFRSEQYLVLRALN